MGKIYGTTDQNQCKKVVPDVKMFGEDLFKLLSKASSESGRWMKSTKALEIDGVGCVVQVTTQQGDNVAEAVTFVPNTYVLEERDSDGIVKSRRLAYCSY
ncbi:MAG: hypothetical protein ACRC7W_02445 [Fusobacteriaceae bacterium]